jgi:hypothetical protein
MIQIMVSLAGSVLLFGGMLAYVFIKEHNGMEAK